MNNPVIFDEEDRPDSLAAHARRSAHGHTSFVQSGIAGSFKHAAVIMAATCVAVISVSIYLLATTVQPTPVLGDDVLRPGESVPSYVR